MASDLGKWAIGLLVGVLALQGVVLSRQTQLKDQLNQVQQQSQDWNRMYAQRLSNLETAVQNRATVPDWMTKPEVAVTADPECRNSTARVTWSLTDWTPGTRSHLQYRRGTGDDWQEAKVTDHGQQSYEAVLDLAGGPGVLWRVFLSKGKVPGAAAPSVIYFPPETAQVRTGQVAMPAYQYRIVTDVPGGGRATAPQVLPLGADLTAQATFNVVVGQNGEYSVAASFDPSPRSSCVQVRTVVARPFAGDKQTGEYPLSPAAGAEHGTLNTRWTAAADLTRIDLVVRYGIHESVIPVDLTTAR